MVSIFDRFSIQPIATWRRPIFRVLDDADGSLSKARFHTIEQAQAWIYDLQSAAFMQLFYPNLGRSSAARNDAFRITDRDYYGTNERLIRATQSA